MAGKGMGGARPGAGRKPDAVTVRTRMMANRMIADGGAAPLEVMIRTMRALWLRATDKKGEVIDMDQAIDACAIAEKAAPYIHPRLAATTDGKGNILPAIFTIKIDGKDGS